MTAEHLCEICVKDTCRKLRALAELENDSKHVSELVKKCDSTVAQYIKAGTIVPPEELKNKVWISKDSLKTWKKLAKLTIVDPQSTEDNTESQDTEETEEGASSGDRSELHGPFNADLFCNHGKLLLF